MVHASGEWRLATGGSLRFGPMNAGSKMTKTHGLNYPKIESYFMDWSHLEYLFIFEKDLTKRRTAATKVLGP